MLPGCMLIAARGGAVVRSDPPAESDMRPPLCPAKSGEEVTSSRSLLVLCNIPFLAVRDLGTLRRNSESRGRECCQTTLPNHALTNLGYRL